MDSGKVFIWPSYFFWGVTVGYFWRTWSNVGIRVQMSEFGCREEMCSILVMISYKQWSIIPTLACTSVLNSYNVFRTWCDQDCVKIFFFRDQSGRAKNQGEQCSLQTEGLSLAETDSCNTLPCPPGMIWRTIALHCIASKNDRRNSRGTLWQKETWLTLFVHQSASITINQH